MRILLAEDDPFTGEMLTRQLAKEGWSVDWVKDGNEAARLQAENKYALLLLDWGLSGRDGLEICSELRRRGDWVPIIMLTSRDAVADRVKGLEHGADDYIGKPYIFPELSARIRRLVARANLIDAADAAPPDKLVYQLGERAIVAGKEAVHLSGKEAALFELLLRHPDRPVSRKCLAMALWEDKRTPTGAVDPLISQLRRRLEPLKPLCRIENIRGKGFILRLEG